MNGGKIPPGRRQVYGEAVEQLEPCPNGISSRRAAAEGADPLRLRGVAKASREYPPLKADVDACPARLKRATEETLGWSTEWFGFMSEVLWASAETAEQLDEALEALKQECLQTRPR